MQFHLTTIYYKNKSDQHSIIITIDTKIPTIDTKIPTIQQPLHAGLTVPHLVVVQVTIIGTPTCYDTTRSIPATSGKRKPISLALNLARAINRIETTTQKARTR